MTTKEEIDNKKYPVDLQKIQGCLLLEIRDMLKAILARGNEKPKKRVSRNKK